MDLIKKLREFCNWDENDDRYVKELCQVIIPGIIIVYILLLLVGYLCNGKSAASLTTPAESSGYRGKGIYEIKQTFSE